jgi:DNA-binding MarR family transcriptional regulator
MAMKLIQDSAANTVGRIAHRLELDPAATTRMLNQLERRGYITRARSTSDRRLVRLDLTEAGREKCTSSTDPILSAWHSVLRGIDCSEVELLVTLLHKLFSAVSDGASHAKSAMTAGTAGWISPLNLADELKEWPVDDGDAEKVDG